MVHRELLVEMRWDEEKFMERMCFTWNMVDVG
jgi:hypothetical protein